MLNQSGVARVERSCDAALIIKVKLFMTVAVAFISDRRHKKIHYEARQGATTVHARDNRVINRAVTKGWQYAYRDRR